MRRSAKSRTVTHTAQWAGQESDGDRANSHIDSGAILYSACLCAGRDVRCCKTLLKQVRHRWGLGFGVAFACAWLGVRRSARGTREWPTPHEYDERQYEDPCYPLNDEEHLGWFGRSVRCVHPYSNSSTNESAREVHSHRNGAARLHTETRGCERVGHGTAGTLVVHTQTPAGACHKPRSTR